MDIRKRLVSGLRVACFAAACALQILPLCARAQFLCTAGSRDGQDCAGDDDCVGGGVCVIPLGVCSGGESDGFFCICPDSECRDEAVCSDDASLGTCAGGVFVELCCDITYNCFDNSPCIGTQRVCIGGLDKGLPCLNDSHCRDSLCRSTGRYCADGDNDSFSCFDDPDCPGGSCLGAVGVPTPTPTPITCVGDCNLDHHVTVDEVLVGVNLILLRQALSACPKFDADRSAEVTIDELVHGIHFLLNGCDSSG